METIQFKTNIKCTGCLTKVTPYLNVTVGESNWKVELESPQKNLIVKSSTSANEIITAVKEAGFEAEKI